MNERCVVCGGELPPAKATGRPALYCSKTCKRQARDRSDAARMRDRHLEYAKRAEAAPGGLFEGLTAEQHRHVAARYGKSADEDWEAHARTWRELASADAATLERWANQGG